MSTGAAGLPPIVESTPADSEGAPPTLTPAVPSSVTAAPVAPARAASPAARRPQSLEARVSRLERVVESQALVEILMRLDDLQRDVQSLRGTLEEQAHVMEGIKRRQRELYLDVDRRLRALEVKQAQAAAAPPGAPAKGGSPAPAASAAPAVPAAAAPATTTAQAPAQAPAAGAAVVDPLEEQAAYQQAFNLLKDGRYEEAIAAFQKFLVRYPKGQFADNAQYWLAEANYVLRRFPTAIEEFNKVLVNYPDSQKIADAMLKIGYCYYELKKWDRARKILEELVKRFPDSTAAQLGRNRLHRMRLEGR
ncbi:MAG TPA: tol-pal system protein YbgF [Gammaproteobacteria bacterium]|nr:tol-pal system protein YbgF [Gammaproteobacteria bacterium]